MEKIMRRKSKANTRLQQMRKQKGLTQVKLAALLGTSISRISAWEHGKAQPLKRMKKEICKILNESEDYLFPE